MAAHPRSQLLMSFERDGCGGTAAFSEALLKHNTDTAQSTQYTSKTHISNIHLTQSYIKIALRENCLLARLISSALKHPRIQSAGKRSHTCTQLSACTKKMSVMWAARDTSLPPLLPGAQLLLSTQQAPDLLQGSPQTIQYSTAHTCGPRTSPGTGHLMLASMRVEQSL